MFRLPTGLIYTHDEGGWGARGYFQLAADSMNGANSMNVGDFGKKMPFLDTIM